MYDRTHNLVSSSSLAKRSSNINTHGRKRMSNKTVLEKMKTKAKIYKHHEEWAKENGYRENDTLNSKNTVGFKDGAER
jgi:hypothetical protein